MKQLLSDILKLLKQHRRTLVRMAIAGAVGFVVVSIGGVYLSSQSWFCDSCHYMEPYVESWRTSSHSEVECHTCHFSSDPIVLMKQKTHAMATTIRYFVGTYDILPRAEVEDEACLQSGCHETRLLDGTVEYKKGIMFDHADHLAETRRGIKLRCTSCHSQMVQGDHIAVTESVCFTCHFRNTGTEERLAHCNDCHGAPTESVTHMGFKLDHAKYVEQGAACDDCHLQITRGNGEVAERRCYSCHMERKRDDYEPAELHKTHVTDHKVECFECHDDIEHGLLELTHSIDIDCQQCHSGQHLTPRDMFAGTGAVGVSDHPSAMFLSKIGCEGCHGFDAGPHTESYADIAQLGQSCVRSHGAGFDKMLTEWRNFEQDGFKAVRPMLERTQDMLKHAQGLSPETQKSVQDAVDRVAGNLDLVESGKSAHNMAYTVSIFDAVQKDMQAAMKQLGATPGTEETGAFFTDNEKVLSCIKTCHVDFGRNMTVDLDGVEFPHASHIRQKGLDCSKCHQNEPDHGVMLIGKEDCSSCHHKPDNDDCASCHKLQAGVVQGKGDGTMVPEHIRKAGPMSEDVPCFACHVEAQDAGAPLATAAACDECHDKGTGKTSIALWQGTTRKLLRESRRKLADITQAAGPEGFDPEAAKLAGQVEQLLKAVERDGSWGVHNHPMVDEILLHADSLMDKLEEKK